MYLPTRRWVAGARSAANPCAASPFCESLILAYQNLSSLLPRPQQKQGARISGRAVDSRARRKQELRSILHAASGVRRVFVGGGLASYRLQSAVRVDFRLPPVCLLTDSPPVPGSGGARPTTTLALPGSPFAASGPICSPRDGQMKQSRLHSCPFCMRQRPAELSANRQRDRQYDDSLSSPHYD